MVGWSHAATENPQGGQQIFVNGQHFSGTAFQLDGTDNQDPILGIIVINPNLDAIQETKIALPELRRRIRQGHRRRRHSADQVRNQRIAWQRLLRLSRRRPAGARSVYAVCSRRSIYRFFSLTRDFRRRLGGPIIKDKLFFFGDYQGVRETSGVTNELTVPTAEVLQHLQSDNALAHPASAI